MDRLLDKFQVTLCIDIDTYQTGNLINAFVKPGVKMRSIKLSEISIFDENYDLIELDENSKELLEKSYPHDEITLVSGDDEMKFRKKGGFTNKELFDMVLQVEKLARPKTDWFGGIDAHHVFFEGLTRVGNKKYSIEWGS